MQSDWPGFSWEMNENPFMSIEVFRNWHFERLEYGAVSTGNKKIRFFCES